MSYSQVLKNSCIQYSGVKYDDSALLIVFLLEEKNTTIHYCFTLNELFSLTSQSGENDYFVIGGTNSIVQLCGVINLINNSNNNREKYQYIYVESNSLIKFLDRGFNTFKLILSSFVFSDADRSFEQQYYFAVPYNRMDLYGGKNNSLMNQEINFHDFGNQHAIHPYRQLIPDEEISENISMVMSDIPIIAGQENRPESNKIVRAVSPRVERIPSPKAQSVVSRTASPKAQSVVNRTAQSVARKITSPRVLSPIEEKKPLPSITPKIEKKRGGLDDPLGSFDEDDEEDEDEDEDEDDEEEGTRKNGKESDEMD